MSVFLHWFSYEVIAERHSGLRLLFGAKLFGTETLNTFDELTNWGCLAAWLTVIAVAISSSLTRLPPRKWMHGIAVFAVIALALAATVVVLVLADSGPGPGGSGEYETGEGMDLLPWSLIMLAIAWVVRLADD